MKNNYLIYLPLSIVLVLQGSGCSENHAEEITVTEEVHLSEAEMQQASTIYLDKCAGCHGSSRKGSIGPSLLPEGDYKYPATKLIGSAGLKGFIENGTPVGMPEWKGIMSDKEIDLMVKFLQVNPPAVPSFGLANIKKTWELLIPVADRPTQPMHKRNIENYFGIIMREAGKVAIIDGDTKEELAVLPTGYAVHFLCASSTGRYIYAVDRDGRVTMIDTYPKVPNIVAKVRGSFDARSVDISKYSGTEGDFKDKYLVFGSYSPSHFVIFDALTLEPLSVTKTSGKACDGKKEFIDEDRVASIISSHTEPIWMLNIKETGMVWLVNYTDPIHPKITEIPTARSLNDGGLDVSGNFLMIAESDSNKVVVVDIANKKLEAIIETGFNPHPGRGANIKNKLGNLWVTSHLGENKLSFIKTNKGEGQWTVVKEIKAPSDGTLFIKSHPKSKHLWIDRTLNPDPSLDNAVDVFDTETFEHKKTITMPEGVDGRMVHIEYNKNGDEVWISVFMGTKSGILVYNDKTLELKQIIKGDWLQNPTSKFNIYNTTHDIY